MAERAIWVEVAKLKAKEPDAIVIVGAAGEKVYAQNIEILGPSRMVYNVDPIGGPMVRMYSRAAIMIFKFDRSVQTLPATD